METKDYLPEQDQDLLLAKSIGKVNEGSLLVSDIDDSLVDILQDYKTAESSREASYNIDSDTLWASIDKEVSAPKQAKITPLPRRNNTFATWAIAASVLVAVFAGIFWLNNMDNTILVAQTGAELAVVTLDDGSKVTLRPNSKLWQKAYSAEEQNYKITGEAYFEVTSNPSRNFIVEAGDGRVTVLGTKFVLSDWGTTSSVFLEEGSVRFENLDGSSSTILVPGQSSIIQNGMVQPSTASAIETHKDWLENTIVLDGQTVAFVFAELEQHYNISLGSETDIYSEVLGGSYTLENIEQTLQDIGTVLGGTFKKTGKQTYRFVAINE